MSRVCELTGKKAMVGNIPEEDKWVTLKVSTSALKTINKIGIAAALKDARAKGFIK